MCREFGEGFGSDEILTIFLLLSNTCVVTQITGTERPYHIFFSEIKTANNQRSR